MYEIHNTYEKRKEKKFAFKCIFCMVKTSISANTHETQVGGQHLQYRDNVILSPT